MVKLIVFDLDGTLAASKSALDAEMSNLLDRLIGVVKVAVISGGNCPNSRNKLLAISSMIIISKIFLCCLHVAQNSFNLQMRGK